MAGQGAGFVVVQVEGLFEVGEQGGYRLPWRAGTGPVWISEARAASWAPRVPVNRAVEATSMPAYRNVAPRCPSDP